MGKKSPRLSPPETDITGKPLRDIAFEAAHGGDLKISDLDPANLGIWDRIAAAVAEAVRKKDAALAARRDAA